MTSKAEKRRKKRVVILTSGGRPRRQGVDRYRDGSVVKSERQSSDPDPMAVARAQPHRRALAEMLFCPKEERTSVGAEALAGSAIGRLLLLRKVQRHHFEAAMRFSEEMARDRSIMGLPPVTTQAMRYGDAPVGVNRAETTTDVAQAAAGRMTKLRLLLASVDCAGDPARPGLVVRQIALEDRDEGTLSEHEIGALRLGLNALARHYGVTICGDRETAA